MVSNVSSVTDCPKCKSNHVNVLLAKGWFVTAICDKGHRWETLSKRCTNCKKPNGFLHNGECLECYKTKH